jgi:hypothetical protein
LDSLPSAAEEQDILKIAKELIEQLNISSLKPTSATWAADVRSTLPDSEKIAPEMAGMIKRGVPNGWCVFTWDRIILPVEMKGKLDPEDWRPLLASSLIYEEQLRKRRDLGFILLSTPVFVDAFGWWELLAVSIPALSIPVSLLLIDIAGLFAALALSGSLVMRFSRRLRLKADTLAAEHVGRETLERVLEKMKVLGLVDSYAGVGWDSGYLFSMEFMKGRPTLAERITNLNRAFSTATEKWGQRFQLRVRLFRKT